MKSNSGSSNGRIEKTDGEDDGDHEFEESNDNNGPWAQDFCHIVLQPPSTFQNKIKLTFFAQSPKLSTCFFPLVGGIFHKFASG
jgi:hypothetical protein